MKLEKTTIEELANYIGMDKVPKSWEVAFETIKNNIPEKIDWLEKEKSIKVLNFYRINDKDFKEKYFEILNLINSDMYLKVLCYLWHYILYVDKTELYKDVWNWKTTNNLYKNAGNYMLPVVVLLSGYDEHIKNMKNRKFDKEQIEEQIKNVNKSCTLDKKRLGIYGIRFSQMVWGAYFIKGKIIQVGRLQYEYEENVPNIVKEYKDGDYMYIHIPRGSKLEEEEVEKSIKESKDKINKFYPEIDISRLQYYTKTWLLSNDIVQILPVDSNIMRFRKKFDVLEQSENTEDFLSFVFQEKNNSVDYKYIKEDTILQRELKKLLLEDKQLHIGLGVLKTKE